MLKVELREKGVSTLKPRNIWFDETVLKLNLDGRGRLLGAFRGEDKLLIINNKGVSRTVTPEMTLHFDQIPDILERWVESKPITAIYFDPEKERYFIKRFLIENENKEDYFIKEDGDLVYVTTEWRPVIDIHFVKPRGEDELPVKEINVEEFIAIKGFKALGNQLSTTKIKTVELKESLPYEIEAPTIVEEVEVNDPEDISDNEQPQIKLDF